MNCWTQDVSALCVPSQFHHQMRTVPVTNGPYEARGVTAFINRLLVIGAVKLRGVGRSASFHVRAHLTQVKQQLAGSSGMPFVSACVCVFHTAPHLQRAHSM